MTDVGKISLGVEIDADALSSKLGEAVRRAIAPALAEVQRELNKVQREYDKTARASNKSTTAQVAGQKAVAESVEAVGNEQTRTAAKTQAAGAVTTRQLNAITRAYERQTAAIAANTAARFANARTPVPGAPANPGRGGGGFGGGGGGSPGRGGGMLSGWMGSGILNAGALALGSWPALATVVTDVAGGVQQLAQAGAVLPGIFAGAASSIGVAVIGFKGLSDAVKALNEAALDPTKLEEANKVLDAMAPAAAELAREVSRLTQGPLKDFQKAIAQPMLEGVAGELTGFTDKVLPRAQTGMGKIATAWNGTLKTLLREGSSDSSLSIMDRIFGNTADAQTRANAAIKPLLSGFGQLAATGTNFLPRLADGLTKVSERFDRFISGAVADGRLDKWIDQGLTGLRQFGESILNILKVFTNLTKAAGSDEGGFLAWLEKVTTRLAEFTGSEEGQERLSKFFTEGREQIAKWLPVLQQLGTSFVSIYEASKQWTAILLPVLEKVLSLINSMPGGLEAAVLGFLAFKTINPFVGLISAMDGLPGRADRAGKGISGALSRIAIPAALSALLIGQTSGMIGPDNSAGSNLGGLALNVGGLAAAGGMIGGVPGAIAGAIAGLGVSIYQRISEEIDQGKAEWEAKWQSDHDAGPNRPGSREGQLAAVPALRGVQLPSQYNADGTPKPLASQSLADKIASGQMGGFTLGPNGTVLGPGGVPIPGLTLPTPTAPAVQGPQVPALPPVTPTTPLPVTITNPTLPPGVGDNTPLPPTLPPGPAIAPTDIGGLLGAPSVADVSKSLDNVKAQITQLPEGKVELKDATPDVIKNLETLGSHIEHLPEGKVVITPETEQAKQAIDRFIREQQSRQIQLQITAAAGAPGLPVVPPRASGGVNGVLPGYSPGVDNMLVPMSGGEGILIPEAVRGIGGAAAVYAINSRFRGGLSRQGYADGGVHLGTGALPGPVGTDTELGVLIQIRDILGGKGGPGSNPLAATAANTATAATAAKDGTGGMGPFGTPLKKRGDPGYEMAAAAISALGGDPEKFLGMDPSTYVAPGMGLPGVTGAGLPVNYAAQSAALAAFARSGNLADVSGLGLNANDPVITALTSARNKKKGGLGDDEIAALVETVLGQGGYTGTLDQQNTPLIKSLTRYREQLMKQQGINPNTGAALTSASSTGLSAASLGGAMDPLSAFAQSVSGGQYEWGASDLSKGLSDCSGAVSDLVEIITKGAADPGRLFSTADARDVLTKLGAVEGAVPGALQIGWSDTHMRSTLPNGVNFESGGGTGQGATYGGNAQGAAGMPNIMSLPAGAVAGLGIPGMGGAGGTGTPVYVTNWPGQGGGGIGGQILGAGLSAAGGAAGDVAGDWISAIGGMGQEGYQKRNPDAALDQLLDERNPMALAKALGFNVQDFTREGGQGGETEKNDEAFDASGRLFSDTTSLMDRTFSSLQAQLSAMREQLVDVIEQTNQKLAESALEPVIKAGMQSALESLKDSVSNSIGSALGNAAAPPIADAVSSAVASLPIDNSGGGSIGADAAGIVAKGFATGGPAYGGTPGVDSIPALLQHGEYVLDTGDVARLGGVSAIDSMRSKGFRRFATGGGVNVNDSVGADFFGVSEVPILSTIINMIVKVLLQVIGIEIEARDTMNEMTDEFRGFRGDAFKAFDAQGRLLNDTSALIERTGTSSDAAAEERIRILKIVIEAVIKYIIEKVIVPIGKAVANAAIQAGASAAGAAVNTQAPGAGGIVSSLISSGGQAGVEIVAEIGSDFAVALTGVLTDVIAEGIQGAAPDLVNALFGGGLLAGLFDPAGGFISTLAGGLFGAIAGLFGGLFGGASTLIPGIPFDNGGMAMGKGLMLKDVDEPELVMNPTETDLFSRFVKALENGGFGRSSTSVHAPITVIGGGRETAEQVENRLLKLMP